MTASTTALHTRNLKSRIGTEIRAEQSDSAQSGSTPKRCGTCSRNAASWCSPQIGFTDDEQVAFTETLGVFAAERAGREGLQASHWTPTVNSSADYLKGSLYWHIDGTMNDVPIRASLLSSRVLPADGGGDTEFCNTYAAYDDLPEEDKAELSGLRAMHSAWNTLFYFEPEPSIEHLRRHDAHRRQGTTADMDASVRPQFFGTWLHSAPCCRHGLPQKRGTSGADFGIGPRNPSSSIATGGR